ncbi:hypothetical protein ROHU_015410 [Labeo rohita]|uniref:Uncharacterized protein n=1 Tax=Labeo rohita TaxID=84645 RepID=A0A498NQ42_LABRO|nr:hypothetical protein ROHU_015410 [Labeo rohita]
MSSVLAWSGDPLVPLWMSLPVIPRRLHLARYSPRVCPVIVRPCSPPGLTGTTVPSAPQGFLVPLASPWLDVDLPVPQTSSLSPVPCLSTPLALSTPLSLLFHLGPQMLRFCLSPPVPTLAASRLWSTLSSPGPCSPLAALWLFAPSAPARTVVSSAPQGFPSLWLHPD